MSWPWEALHPWVRSQLRHHPSFHGETCFPPALLNQAIFLPGSERGRQTDLRMERKWLPGSWTRFSGHWTLIIN